METPNNSRSVIEAVRAAIGVLELDRDSALAREATESCDRFERPEFRIAVFGPFNYGKSTLLNAILGKRALPIDLVPTTGAAIYVRYGETLTSRIYLTDGSAIAAEGTKVLQEYAILDEQRRMREDVSEVEVFCQHPLLQMGVEFLDLPGTDDREAQNRLVKEKLLTADLIVQVLDARKLMTLGEREHLRDWLLDRGITTVVFVVNFLNLLEPEERKAVQNRLRFVAESFRADLPSGISNIYRVDALPALRARLKGDSAAAQATGLVAFESALQSIAIAWQENGALRWPRVREAARKLRGKLQEKTATLQAKKDAETQKQRQQVEIVQKAGKLIWKGYQRSSSEFQSWLYLPTLLARYETELAAALASDRFAQWEQEFQNTVRNDQQKIQEWVEKGKDFFGGQAIAPLIISFPDTIQVASPQPDVETETKSPKVRGVAPIAIATGLGWVLGGPLGAAVVGSASYVYRKASGKEVEVNLDLKFNRPQQNDSDREAFRQLCAEASKTYLTQFSEQAFAELHRHEQQVEKLLAGTAIAPAADSGSTQDYQLQLLQNLADTLAV